MNIANAHPANEKTAILQWAENNRTIFAQFKELDSISAKIEKTPRWDFITKYKLERQYEKYLINITRMGHYNNQSLKASML